jgi:hypothetical protein
MNSKAREALKYAKRTLCRWQADLPVSGQVEVEETLLKIKSALAEPLRNCDVGTVEEQEDRFADFCRKRECTIDCPIKKKWSGHKPSCGILWSQMPYESEVSNES